VDAQQKSQLIQMRKSSQSTNSKKICLMNKKSQVMLKWLIRIRKWALRKNISLEQLLIQHIKQISMVKKKLLEISTLTKMTKILEEQ
jgi:hypothetical protein